MKNKNIMIIAATSIIVCFMAASCQITGLFSASSEIKDEGAVSTESDENKTEAESKEESEEVIVDDEAEEEASDRETEENIEMADGDEEVEEEISGEKNSEELEGSITDEEILEDTLLAFFDAVVIDDEYSYFSSGTIALVGSEAEYKNGDKSDIYFIIKESHSSWENIKFGSIIITNDKAVVAIIADRMAEGTKYEDDKVEFDFVKENEQWKIDFSF